MSADQNSRPIAQNIRLWSGVPPIPNHFVGRETEANELVRSLTQRGVYAVSVEGMPGVGKTALATFVAHNPVVQDHFEDGTMWANLGTHVDVSCVLQRWARTLHIDIAEGLSNETVSEAIKEAIGVRSLLLIIDDAWRPQTAELLRCGGPHCVHLFTTRNQALAKRFADQVLRIDELSESDARDLLRKIAPDVYDTNPVLADWLLAACGYLPLAIDVLGSFLSTGPNGRFARNREEALAALNAPACRLAMPGKRVGFTQDVTLQETVALTVEALRGESTRAARVFYRLGAFAPKPARFSLDAAQCVSGGDSGIFALLADYNLLEIDQEESFALHPILRDVARTRTPGRSFHRHRDHYLALVDKDREDWRSISAIYIQVQEAWQHILEQEDKPRLLDFVWALYKYQMLRGLWQDILDWAEAGLRWSRDVGTSSSEAALLHHIGRAQAAMGDRQQAIDTLSEAFRIARASASLRAEAAILNDIGAIHRRLGEPQRALSYHEEAFELVRSLRDGRGVAATLKSIGMIYAYLGDMHQALGYYDNALQFEIAAGDELGEASVLSCMGAAYQALGEQSDALACLNKALTRFRKRGDSVGEAVVLINLAAVQRSTGEMQEALVTCRKALSIFETLGDQSGRAAALNNIGLAYSATGEKRRALDTYNQALALRRAVGDKRGEATTLNNIACAQSALGEKEEAINHYVQCLELRRKVEDRWGERLTRHNLARLYRINGDLDKAEKELTSVVNISQAIGHPDLERDRTTLSQLQALRAHTQENRWWQTIFRCR